MTAVDWNTVELGCTWADLREGPITALGAGDVMVKLGALNAYLTSADGRVAGVLGWTPRGSRWDITAREGNTFTVRRSDGQREQTFTASADMTVTYIHQGRANSVTSDLTER